MGDAPKRDLARITESEIGDVYNGMQGLRVMFEYECGGAQGLSGYLLDASMVIRFMNAVGGLNKLSEAVGRSVWVTHTWNGILAVEPLHKKDGTPFVIAEWQEWVKRRMPPLSYSELCDGVDPKDKS